FRMSLSPPSLDALCKSMNSYAGRDKIVRSLAFMSALQAFSSQPSKEWAAFAKQLSSARLVFRQFNHPGMIKGCLGLMQKAPEDEVERYCAYTVTGVYTVYGIVECVAWLADAKLINGDSVKLFRYCLYLWLTALFAGIVRQVRVLVRKGEWSLEKVKEDLLLLISFCCDFTSGVNSLPAGMLWAGKLQPKTTAKFSLIASLIGFYRTF
ncbi:prx-11, partial [Pristionchus pacificus]|uniref:Uncharacterized protein n=1 Tax=Pristionchus pacificus TaxID=54126 RepID=A0A8R1Z629_PRIPA